VSITLANVRHGCRWVVGNEGRGEDTLMCGASHESGSSYCPEHAEIARGEAGARWTPERRVAYRRAAMAKLRLSVGVPT
jgi:hypothetical protein